MKNIIFLYCDQKSKRTILVDTQSKHYNINCKTNDLFEHWCARNGSNYRGSKATFSMLMKTKQKTPILVSISKNICFFPTHSEKNEYCIYVNYAFIKEIKEDEYKNAIIIFYSGTKLTCNCCKRVVKKQLKICQEFMYNITCDNDFEIEDLIKI